MAAARFSHACDKGYVEIFLKPTESAVNAVFRMIDFRWFYKGLAITVRFGSWRRGPSPFYGGSAEASLKNPKES